MTNAPLSDSPGVRGKPRPNSVTRVASETIKPASPRAAHAKWKVREVILKARACVGLG